LYFLCRGAYRISILPIHSLNYLQIDRWFEERYPSFIQLPNSTSNEPSLDPSDARSIIAKSDSEFDNEIAYRKRMIEICKGDRNLAMARINAANDKHSAGYGTGQEFSMAKLMIYVSATFVLLIALGLGAAYGVTVFYK